MTILNESRSATALFSWETCIDWKYYLKNPAVELTGKVLCWMGEHVPLCGRLHKWYTHTVKLIEIRRTCERCGGYQIYTSKKDYTGGRWGKTVFND